MAKDVTYRTDSPASRRALAVPPDATSDSPTDTSLLANSNSPVLSDTLNSALELHLDNTTQKAKDDIM